MPTLSACVRQTGDPLKRQKCLPANYVVRGGQAVDEGNSEAGAHVGQAKFQS